MGDESLTYERFYERALAIGGNLLGLGLSPGDRVAFCLANSPRLLETVYGCFAAGLVVVPVNARLHAKEMAYIVGHSGARVLVHGPEYIDGITANAGAFAGVDHRFCTRAGEGVAAFDELHHPARALPAPVDVDSSDPCWLFYTSGTTGKPKGAIWSHRVVRVTIMNYLADVYNIQPGSVVVHAAPLSHGSGIVALPAVARAASNVILDTASFEPRALFALIEATGASHVAFLAPTQIVKMLEDHVPGEYDLSSLEAVCYGGAPMHVAHLRRAVDTFGPVFVQIYGQGEAPITITALPAADHRTLLDRDDPRIGSAGRTRTDVEARCVDADDNPLPPGEAGEVVARGDVVMLGYWDDPDATAETLRGGWLHTGDIGAFDERGYLFLLDRAKDMIITGGNNVYPREVEEVLITHPAVRSVVVVGIPDPYWGEAVHAVVVLEAATTASARDLIDFCGQHLAGYKKPKAVDFRSSLPVSGYGKILRREVRADYWAGRDTAIGGAGAPARPQASRA